MTRREATLRLIDAAYREQPGWRPTWRRKPATWRQVEALGKAGIEVPEGTDHKQAAALLELVTLLRMATRERW